MLAQNSIFYKLTTVETDFSVLTILNDDETCADDDLFCAILFQILSILLTSVYSLLISVEIMRANTFQDSVFQLDR